MRSNKKEYLFFDLDGTILNSFEGIRNSFIYSFNKMNTAMPTESIKNFIGPPLSHSIAKYFNNEEDILEMIKHYRSYYLEKGLYECELYDGVSETLEVLKRRGYKLYLATSKPTHLAIKLLDRFNISHLFLDIYGAEDDSNKGSKELVLAHALSVSGAEKEKSIMIGDSIWDLKGAEINNIDFGAVLYGFGEEETIRKDNNYFTVEKVEDILAYLA